ncbi:hypothetical protein FB451DRAFT_1001870, partial [Mycena latifolia]
HRAVSSGRADRIPSDILALVFVFALPEHMNTVPSENDVPLSVSHVCRLFRRVALETPQLWSTITFDFSRP